jgi:hypothetical protein
LIHPENIEVEGGHKKEKIHVSKFILGHSDKKHTQIVKCQWAPKFNGSRASAGLDSGVG